MSLKNSRIPKVKVWVWWGISLFFSLLTHFSWIFSRIRENYDLLPYYDDISIVLSYVNLQKMRLPYISPEHSSVNFVDNFPYHFNWEYFIESFYRALLQWNVSMSYLPSIGIILTFAFLIYFLTKEKMMLGLFLIILLILIFSGLGINYFFQTRYMFFVLVSSLFVSLFSTKIISPNDFRLSKFVLVFACCFLFLD